MESSGPCTEKIRLFVRVYKSYWIYHVVTHTIFFTWLCLFKTLNFITIPIIVLYLLCLLQCQHVELGVHKYILMLHIFLPQFKLQFYLLKKITFNIYYLMQQTGFSDFHRLTPWISLVLAISAGNMSVIPFLDYSLYSCFAMCIFISNCALVMVSLE